MRRAAFTVVATIAASLACSDSNGPGGPNQVALFTNSGFVAYDTATYYAEASQVEHTLKGFGIAVSPVTAYDSASLAANLTTNRVFVIPEQPTLSSLADSLSVGAKTLLRRFVDSLGGVLILHSGFGGIALLDTLFGESTVEVDGDNSYQLGSDAAGTAFAGGAPTIWDNDEVLPVDLTTIPSGLSIYEGATGGTVVAIIPRGTGAVVLLGWDFYNAAPHGPQDGGWLDILRRALRS